ncbi:MAG TPA: hypothetical protein VGF87_00375 [Acidimicrobiales bacterium]
MPTIEDLAPYVGFTQFTPNNPSWMVDASGGVIGLPSYGDLLGVPLNKPIVGMAATPDGKGYWLVASDGGIFSFGDAPYLGSGVDLNDQEHAPAIGMFSYANASQYLIVLSDGSAEGFGVDNLAADK